MWKKILEIYGMWIICPWCKVVTMWACECDEIWVGMTQHQKCSISIFLLCGQPNVWTTIIGTFAKLLHLILGMGWKQIYIDNVDI